MATALDGWKVSGLLFQVALPLLVPIGVLVYLRARLRMRFRPLWVGMGVFVVFSLILEGRLNNYLLGVNPTTKSLLGPAIPFAAYAALAAGLFEEGGRYVGFKLLLPKHRELRDGLAYGTGHGGTEALLIGFVSSLQALVLVLQVASGHTAGIPQATLDLIHTQLASTPRLMFYIGGLERLFAFVIQMGLSLLVLLAVRKNRLRLLFLAIGLHAAVDVFAALYQRAAVSLWLAEGAAGVAALLAVWALLTSSRWWPKSVGPEAPEAGGVPGGKAA
jgi:uncharacterized membrane protein YhfC